VLARAAKNRRTGTQEEEDHLEEACDQLPCTERQLTGWRGGCVAASGRSRMWWRF